MLQAEGDILRGGGTTQGARNATTLAKRLGARVVRLVCLASLLAALAGCDSATVAPTASLGPTTAASVPTATAAAPSATPVATALASSTPRAAAFTPLPPTVQACSAPAVAGTIPLMALPGAVRDPVAFAVNQGKVYVAARGTQNIGVVQNDRLEAVLPASDVSSAIVAGGSPGELFVYYPDAQTIEHYVSERLQSTLALSPTLAASGGYLGDMLGDPAGQRLFVRVGGDHAMFLVIDSRTFSITDRIPFTLSTTYTAMTLDSEHNHLWVVHSDRAQAYGDALSEIDIASHAVIQTIHLPGTSNHVLAWDRVSGRILVATHSSSQSGGNPDNLSVYGGGRLVAQIPGTYTYGSAIIGRRLYVVSINSMVSVIDLDRNQLVTTIATGPSPRAIVADPATQRVYLIPNGVNRLEIVDAQSNTLAGVVALTGGADQLLADPARGRLYALLRASKEVVVSDGSQVLGRVPLERAPAQMALDDGSGRLYVTDSLANDVSIIDGAAARLVEHHPLDGASEPGALAVDRRHNRLLVNNRVYQLDSLTASGQFTLTGASEQAQTVYHTVPAFLLVNPSVPRVYAVGNNGLSSGSGNTSVLYLFDGDTMKQSTVAPSRDVGAIVLDDAAQRVYVAGYPFAVYDAVNLNPITSLDGVIAISAMALNPATHHLFLTQVIPYAPKPSPVLAILDTRTLGQVLTMTLSSAPATLATLGDRIFMAGPDDGNILVVRDCAMAAPAAPTATPTLAPFHTETPTATPVGKTPTAKATAP